MAATVRTCKNQWFKDMANSVQYALAQGNPNVMWRDIQAICQCRAVLQPVRPRAIRKQDGSFCIGPVETVGRWRKHFEGVLNVESSFDQALIDDMPQFPLRGVLSDPPGEDEVRRALRRLSVGKAGGDNGVLPDLLKCCGDALVTHIVTLFTTVWREQRIPAEWHDALLVSVPKKGIYP